VRERARAQYTERCRSAEESALDGDAGQREALKAMLSWEAFEAFFAVEKDAITRSLNLSFVLEV